MAGGKSFWNSTFLNLPFGKRQGISSLKFYLNLMTILKSLKSCINLNLTSSETQLNYLFSV